MRDGTRAGGFEPPCAGDVWGGLAAAAVLLPQAMAFGVTLYAAAGFGASAGAYAGLVGTALMCLVSGAAGGTRGLISAPTGPTLVLLGGAVTGLATSGLDGPGVTLGLAVTIALTGALQLAFGASGGGRLIKYIPFPVVSGFMTGSAVLMIVSQFEPLTGSGVDQDWSTWRWLPAAAAVVTVAGTRLVPRALPQLPGPIAGLALGTLAFHLLALVHGGSVPQAWVIGSLPGFGASALDLPRDALGALPWGVIVPAATALAVLASLDTLLTAVVADVATGTRHDSRREMIGQGLGQLGIALAGGMAAAGTTAATVVAIRSGGGRWVAGGAGLVFLALTAFAGEAGHWLPIGALAGVIIAVAFDVADRDILTWARGGRTRQDAAIAVLVTLITVLYDLMVAVGVGVAIAIGLFIREQIAAAVVHRRSTAREMRSLRARPEAERAVLDAHGDRIIVYELRGNLFFGTADRLIDELGEDLDAANWIILHLRRVSRIDLTAVKFLQQIANRVERAGGTLLFSELHRGTGLEGTFAEVFRSTSERHAAPVLTFNSRDEALEFAEDALLAALAHAATRVDDRVELAGNALCRYLEASQVATLAAHLGRRDAARGEVIFSGGDPGDRIFLLESGQIEVRVATTAHHYRRLAIYGPGSFMGELALLKGGSRAASAVATAPTRCWTLERAEFERLKQSDPDLTIGLLSAICDTLVTNQRWSTRELQRLSEW